MRIKVSLTEQPAAFIPVGLGFNREESQRSEVLVLEKPIVDVEVYSEGAFDCP